MAEFVANAIQTVPANANVQFTDTVVNGNCSIIHRSGSGLITLRGVASHCRTRFKVTFGANIAIPADGTVAPLSLAIAIDGEPLASTTMISTPTAVSQFNNVSASVFLDVPHCDGMSLSVRNTATEAVEVQNANIIIELV